MLYPLIRKFFFALDAETAHGIGMHGVALLDATGLAGCLARPVTPCPVDVMGLKFPNPVGLAAGLDKNGDHIDGLARLGFGFIEIGTVTPKPQDGNPRPRLFRIPEAQGIINRMGFNNDGVDKLLENVRAADFPKKGGILGINIGKNFDTPNERAADDYVACLRAVYPRAHYVTVNISSPNTKGLRDLQAEDALADGHLGAGLELDIGRSRQMIGMDMRLNDPFERPALVLDGLDDGVGAVMADAPGCIVKIENAVDHGTGG